METEKQKVLLSLVELLNKELLKRQLREMIDGLGPYEKQQIVMRFDHGQVESFIETQHQPLTRERVRQIEARALKRLRYPSGTRKLNAWIKENKED